MINFPLFFRQKNIYLDLQDGKQRFIREVAFLSQAFALSMPHPEAMEIKEEVAFFQAVKSRLVKFDG